MTRNRNRSQAAMPEKWSRDWIILVFFGIFLICIIAQLFNIQVIRGAEYSQLAANAHTSNITLSARRGTVYDRNGEVIASNIDAMTIYVNPKEVSDPIKLSQTLESVLGPTTGKTYADYYKIVTQSNLSFAYILRKADVNLANELKTKLEADGTKGIHYLEDTKRVYPNGEVGSQIVGQVDVDGNGIAGLELQYDTLLKGEDGKLIEERGQKDIPISGGEVTREDAVDGIDIVTSVDIKLQKRCEEALLSAISKHEANGGSVCVYDAKTGEIYASCSYVKRTDEEIEAEYEAQVERQNALREVANRANANKLPNEQDNVQVEEGIDVNIPLYKLEVGKLGAITDVYEPGSTFKPFTVLSVLENVPEINADTTYTVPYALDVYDATITDSHDHDTEEMSIRRILAESSNTGTTLVSRAVERATLYATYAKLHLGEKTGVDFPGDASGLLEKASDWDGVQGATVTFGQGLTISRLQLLRAYGALEQNGVERVPHFLLNVPNDAAKTEELLAPYSTSEVVADAADTAEINDMLRSVVTSGTGSAAAIDGFTVVGKTGTAEVAGNDGRYLENVYVMSFCGWLYGSSSDLICLVTVDRPVWGTGGGEVCGPVFADIMSYAAERYQIDAQAK